MTRRDKAQYTKKTSRARELMERAELRCKVLAGGVARELQFASELSEYRRLVDLMAADLGPAMKDYHRAKKAFWKLRKIERRKAGIVRRIARRNPGGSYAA